MLSADCIIHSSGDSHVDRDGIARNRILVSLSLLEGVLGHTFWRLCTEIWFTKTALASNQISVHRSQDASRRRYLTHCVPSLTQTWTFPPFQILAFLRGLTNLLGFGWNLERRLSEAFAKQD
jgi:hypothetical protein